MLTSSPSGAKVYVDEVASGQTPVTVAALPGEHIVRFELAGYLGATDKLRVESYEKVEKGAELAVNPSMQALKQLEADVPAGGIPSSPTCFSSGISSRVTNSRTTLRSSACSSSSSSSSSGIIGLFQRCAARPGASSSGARAGGRGGVGGGEPLRRRARQVLV